jgi:hypothetical protein
MSYGERVDFGITVDPDLIQDPWLIAEGIPAALAELLAAAELGEPTHVEDAFAEPTQAAKHTGSAKSGAGNLKEAAKVGATKTRAKKAAQSA